MALKDILKSARATTFHALLSLLFVGMFVLADLVVGQTGDISAIRADSKQFRSEVAPLITSTHALLPNLDHHYQSPYRPEGAKYFDEDAPRRLRTDPQGYIWGGPSGAAPNNQKKILFLGGSTTECNEVDEPFRFPHLVGTLLAARGEQVTTVNAGVRGHTTLDSINALLNRATLRDADIVVMMHNINDRLRLALQGNYNARIGKTATGSAAQVTETSLALASSIFDFATYNSNIIFALRQQSTSFFAFGSAGPQTEVSERTIDFGGLPPPESLGLFSDNLRIFVAAVRSLGKTPVLMTQPLARRSLPQDAFNDAIRKVSYAEGVLLIDLEAEIKAVREPLYLGDDIHFSNLGSQVVANLIAEKLQVALNDRPSSREELPGLVEPSSFIQQCKALSQNNRGRSIKVIESARYPSFSPDGRLMLFQGVERGEPRIGALEIDTGRIIRLTKLGEGSERHPAFLSYAPNQFQVIFGSGTDRFGKGHERLQARHWPTYETTTIELGNLSASIPAVAGGEIFFSGSNANGAPNIFKLTDQGPKRLTPSQYEQWRPALSPQGDLYFIQHGKAGFDILRLEKGSDTPTLFFGSPSDEWDPAISHDGQSVAFASRKDGNWNLYLLSSANAGGTAIQLTSDTSDEWDPAFHPTEPVLAYARSASSGSEVWLMCLKDSGLHSP